MERQKENLNFLTRRQAIKSALAGTAALAFGDKLSLLAKAQSLGKTAKAKSVIQIWMWGGPCHLDTFDPKPEAGNDYCGLLNKAIETNVPGIRINGILPLLSKQADKYSIIRSMTHGSSAHETAAYMVQTGHRPDRLVYPSMGAVVSVFKGYDGGYKGLVPPYIVLTQGQGRFSEAGFLGEKYKPFVTGGDPKLDPFAVEGIIAKGITDQQQQARRELLHDLDSLGKVMPDNEQFKKLDTCEKNAYELMFGDARKVFDLTQEKAETRDRYGRTTFGQSCLMARRLVERGVPYVTINFKGWDTHKQHFQLMARQLPEMDKAMSTLLEDLSSLGLLDSTIVWWSGEFGRTPKVQWDPPWNGGRGHFGNCFSALVAGGGFKGGQVVGASNDKGTEVAQRPVYPCDLLGSICSKLGIDPEGTLPNSRGMDIKVMPMWKESQGLLKEIM